MANELDKTIEELEAEVLSELEEAADAPIAFLTLQNWWSNWLDKRKSIIKKNNR